MVQPLLPYTVVIVNDTSLQLTRLHINILTNPEVACTLASASIRAKPCTQHAVCGININFCSSHESPEVRVERVAMCRGLVLMLAHAQTSHLLLHLGHLWGGEIGLLLKVQP